MTLQTRYRQGGQQKAAAFCGIRNKTASTFFLKSAISNYPPQKKTSARSKLNPLTLVPQSELSLAAGTPPGGGGGVSASISQPRPSVLVHPWGEYVPISMIMLQVLSFKIVAKFTPLSKPWQNPKKKGCSPRWLSYPGLRQWGGH